MTNGQQSVARAVHRVAASEAGGVRGSVALHCGDPLSPDLSVSGVDPLARAQITFMASLSDNGRLWRVLNRAPSERQKRRTHQRHTSHGLSPVFEMNPETCAECKAPV